MEGQRQQFRLSRLGKQSEFDFEEKAYTPSPVTIHIEDGCEENEQTNNCSNHENYSEENPSFAAQVSADEGTSQKSEKDLSSGRSHAQSKVSGRHLLVKQSSSQGSVEGSSPSLSRDSSTETYTDSTGIDLQQFILDTLYKSQKDRMMLLKIEQDLITLVKDTKCQLFKFAPMSSYNRMLVHRVAAFFGLEHNVDKAGMSVIVNKTKNTRIPDFRFQEHIRDELIPEEPKKLILKRDSASFEEGKESPDRQSSMDSKRSKSFEEREEEYEKARARIFNQDEGYGESPYNRSQDGTLSSSRRSSQEDLRWNNETRPWSSTDSDSSGRKGESFEAEGASKGANKSTAKKTAEQAEGTSNSVELLSAPRPVVSKASSFGGISLLTREPEKTQKLNKAESFNTSNYTGPPSSEASNVVNGASAESAPPKSSTLQTKPEQPNPLPNPPTVNLNSSVITPSPLRNNGISDGNSTAVSQPTNTTNVSRKPTSSDPVNQAVPTTNSIQSSSQNSNKETPGTQYWNGGAPHIQAIRLPESEINMRPIPVAAPVLASPQIEEVQATNSKQPIIMELQRQQPTYPAAQAPQQITMNNLGNMNGNHHPGLNQMQMHAAAAAFQQQQQGGVIYIPIVSNHHHQQLQQQQNFQQANNQVQVQRNMFHHQERTLHRMDSDLANQMSALSFAQHDGKSQNYYQGKEQSYIARQQQTQQQVPLCIQQMPGNPQCCAQCPPNMQNKDSPDNPQPGHQYLQGYSFILNPQENYVSVPYMGGYQTNISGPPSMGPPGLNMTPSHPSSMVPSPHTQSSTMVVASPHVPTAIVTTPTANTTVVTTNVGSPVSVLPPSHPHNFPYILNGPNSSQTPRGTIFGAPPLCFVGNCASNSNGYPTTVMPNNPSIGYTTFLPMHHQQQPVQHHPHQQNGVYPFVPTLHLLRPSIPVIGHNATQSIIPPPLATPPPQPQQQPQHHQTNQSHPNNPKGPYLPFGKNSGPESSDHQMKGINMKGPTGVNVLGGSQVRYPPNPSFHRGIRPMQDVHLLGGPPAGGAFNNLLLRPPRFPPPHVQFSPVPSGASSRSSPKFRKPCRNRWSAPPLPPRTNAEEHYNRGNVLEVEGIPDGLKRMEVERYLELVLQAGAKLHFPNDTKCDGALNSVARGPGAPRGVILAIFETPQAAQSALLNISSTKFQLRSSNRHRPPTSHS